MLTNFSIGDCNADMKILHLNCNYLGTTLHQLMVERLEKIGYNNTVYVPTYDKNVSVIVPNENVIVSECFNKWDRLIFDYKQNKIFKDVQEKLDVKAFDCIHAYTLFTDGNCARNLSEKYNIPFVVAVRNTDVNDFFAKMIHLRSRGIQTMRKAKAVFFLSEAYRKQVFDKYVPEEFKYELLKKTCIIPNGIDKFWFDNEFEMQKTLSREELKLVFAGRIDKNKNVLTTQKAMEILRKRGYNVSLTVVGKAQGKSEVERISKNIYTTVLDAKPKEQLIDVYRSSDIFVMPSFTESFGLVYAEAMSQGLPVIYSEGQGFDCQFEEGTVGFHVSPYDPESVANGIERLVESYASIQKNVVESARRFTWDEIVKKYVLEYQKIFNQGNKNNDK